MRIPVAWLLLVMAGCSPYDDLPLIDVTAVEPPQIEPGGRLRIDGEGFPLGLASVVTLEGTVFRPGDPPVAFETRLPADVETESRIVVPIPEDLMDSLGGRATFDGRLRLAFRAASDARDVYAERAVVLDFLPDTTLLLASDSEETPSSIGAHDFGVVLSREESGVVGVRVESVTEDGPAELQGVRSGDTIVQLDGVRVYSWRDFAPDPSRTESRVSVARNGLAGVHALRWPHEATLPRATPAALVVMLILGLILGWRSPMLLCLRCGEGASTAVWLTRASALLVLSTALICVGALGTTTGWIFMLGGLAALNSLAPKLRRPGLAGASLGLMIASTVAVMILARTASLPSINETQDSWLSWFAFRTPASTLAFVAYVAALGRVADFGRLTSIAFAAAAATFGAALFVGGGGFGAAHEQIGLLFVKAGVLLVVSRWVALELRSAAWVAASAVALATLLSFGGADLVAPYWGPIAAGSILALALRAALPPLRRNSVPSLA